jgi:hypothetical protein
MRPKSRGVFASSARAMTAPTAFAGTNSLTMTSSVPPAVRLKRKSQLNSRMGPRMMRRRSE